MMIPSEWELVRYEHLYGFPVPEKKGGGMILRLLRILE